MSYIAKRIRLVFFCALLVAASVSSITFTYLASKNSLYENGKWEPYKTLIKRIPEESFHFLFSRVTLKRNELNLSSWRGFHEITSKRWFDDLYQVSFTVQSPEKDSWFSFFVRDKQGRYAGVRMHDRPHKSIFFKGSPIGEFVERFRIEKQPGNISRAKKIHCIATFVDGKIIFSADACRVGMMFLDGVDPPVQIGFSGGYKKLIIDDVLVKDSARNVVFADSFSNRCGMYQVMAVSLVLVLFLLFVGIKQNVFKFERLVDRMGRGIIGHRVKKFFSALGGTVSARAFIVLSIIALISVSVFLLDHYIMVFNVHRTRGWNPLAPLMEKTFGRSKIGRTPFLSEVAKREREYIKSYQNRAIIADVYKRFENKPKKENDLRIMFFGGSPTFGEGVNSRLETFPEIAGRVIEHETGLNVDIINLAMVDATTDLILEKYKSEWFKFKPDMVLINLCSGRNETPDNFVDNMMHLVWFNNSMGIETMILLEPHSDEKYPNGWHSYHDMNKTVANRTQVPLIDLVKFMNLASDTGFLWLDEVHLRLFGHKTLGEYLAQRVLAKTKLEKITKRLKES